jgi:nucleoside-diphosphate-sugar epimerase
MQTLVVGASGATGRLLVRQLLERGERVKVIVRSAEGLPEDLRTHENVAVVQGSVTELTDAALAEHVEGCREVASCLGHNMTMRGMYGKPRRLVADTVRRLCDAIRTHRPTAPVKFVLMNTTGNRNRDLAEQVSLGQQVVLLLLRTFLPPHADNEHAADYLRVVIGQQDPVIEWTAVRPDNLSNEDTVSRYDVHASPIRSAIFDAGITSRVNVAHFMAQLITDDTVWHAWKGQMPVIYNAIT